MDILINVDKAKREIDKRFSYFFTPETVFQPITIKLVHLVALVVLFTKRIIIHKPIKTVVTHFSQL